MTEVAYFKIEKTEDVDNPPVSHREDNISRRNHFSEECLSGEGGRQTEMLHDFHFQTFVIINQSRSVVLVQINKSLISPEKV